jgi:hypothetical protein
MATATKTTATKTTATKKPRALSAEQLGRMLGLIKGADSVELKLTVPESDQRSAISSLGIDPLDAQIRQVFFYDTPDLKLYKMGLVVRARRIQGKGGDTVVKLRPIVPDDLPADLRKSPSFGVEVDAMPGGYVCSASLKGKAGINDAREVAAGARPIRKLFSKAQRAFFSEHARDGINLDDLSVLGPIVVFKLRFVPADYDRSLVAELWMYPDNSRILELSTKCLPSETFQIAAETRAFLHSKGVIYPESRRKRRLPRSSFSKQLPCAGAPAAKHDSARNFVTRRARIFAMRGVSPQ